MKRKVITIIRIFLFLFVYFQRNEASDIESLLMKKVLREVNTFKNVIIAPKQIQKFLHTSEDLQNEEKFEEEGELNQIPSHVQIIKNPIHSNIYQQMKSISRRFENETYHGNERTVIRNCIHAVTINTKWKFNFQRRDTHKRIFFNTPDQHIYLDTMRKDDIFQYGEIEHWNATVVELPLFAANYYFVLLLPRARNGLSQLARSISQDLNILHELNKYYLHSSLVRVFLPTIHLSTKIQMDEIAQKANIPYQDFDSLTHHAHIEVNEQGLGQSEKTTVLFWNAFSSFRTTPKLFNTNHPFMFFIRNQEGIQFFGYVSDLK